jgi:hypothetical protein
MTRTRVSLLAITASALALAACGTDGPPESPASGAVEVVESAAGAALEPGISEVEVGFDSHSTSWTAGGVIDLEARRYRVHAHALEVRQPRLGGRWLIYGMRDGVFWSWRPDGDRGLHRCFVDGFLAGGSFGGALSTERAMGLLEAYVRLLAEAVATAQREDGRTYAVELDPREVARARALERDAGGFGGRLSGLLVAPRAPIRVRVDPQTESLLAIDLRLRATKPERRYGIPPPADRSPERSRLRIGFISRQEKGRIAHPPCAGIE